MSKARPIEMDSVICPGPQVVSASQDGEMVLLDLSTGEYYTLNETAGRVWLLICKGASLPSMIEELTGYYDVPVDQLRTDVLDALTRLRDAHLVSATPRS